MFQIDLFRYELIERFLEPDFKFWGITHELHVGLMKSAIVRSLMVAR